MAEPFKTCSCGRQFTCAQYFWLPTPGPLDDGCERLDLRNCPDCHSTRAATVVSYVAAKELLIAERERDAA